MPDAGRTSRTSGGRTAAFQTDLPPGGRVDFADAALADEAWPSALRPSLGCGIGLPEAAPVARASRCAAARAGAEAGGDDPDVMAGAARASLPSRRAARSATMMHID